MKLLQTSVLTTFYCCLCKVFIFYSTTALLCLKDPPLVKLNVYFFSLLLFLHHPESSFMVSASSRTPSVTFGDSFDLLCLVKPRHNPRVPTSVTWRFMPASKDANGEDPGEFKDLVTFTREGTLQWGEQQLGLGTRTTVDRSHSNTNFRLLVTRAGRREAGKYQCTAILWRRNYDNSWSRVANRTSNLLGISVIQPGNSTQPVRAGRLTGMDFCKI